MKQNIKVVNSTAATFRPPAKIVFNFCAEANCGDSNSYKKGDSK
jgi:hypothetical protein